MPKLDTFAKMIWSQCRSINVMVEEKVIKYNIPIYSEEVNIGKIKNISINNKTLEIVFHRREK